MAINFADGLCLVFITLKLCGVIDWSWFVVLSPYIVKILLRAIVSTYEQEKGKIK